MNSKHIIAAFLFVSAVTAYFLTFRSKERAVSNLENVAQFIEPEAYYVTGRVYKLQNSQSGQRVALLPRQLETGKFGTKPHFDRQEGFVGPESCQECHAEFYEGFVQTAHYKTSALADGHSILGSFDEGENVLKTRQKGFRYEMTQQDEAFIQCHQPDDCGQFAISGSRIAENCIDCHMPKRDDSSLEIETTTDSLFPQIRDHYIRVETEATRKVLESWK